MFLISASIIFFIHLNLINAQNGLGNVMSYEEFGNNMSISPFKKCRDSSPPNPLNQQRKIPSYLINLDLPAEDRWRKVSTDFKPQIYNLIDTLRNQTDRVFGGVIFKFIDKYLPLLTKTLPRKYYLEIIGISEALELPVGEVTIFNVFYEFSSLCTSILMEDKTGKIYHGRNLDFGFPFGWDTKNDTWYITELLRPLVVKLEFQRNAETIYSSVQFAGYIGILTGIKKNAFAISVNQRFKLDGGIVGIVEWLLGRHNQKWNGIITREVMELAHTYGDAKKMLMEYDLVAPVYFILSGNEPKEGCVITRGRDNVDIWNINNEQSPSNNSWYLVQTNYDHWKKPPTIDDRVVPSVICLELLGRENPVYTLYNVLSTIPVLNKETIYTTVMEPFNGEIKTWLQDCPNPCWPW